MLTNRLMLTDKLMLTCRLILPNILLLLISILCFTHWNLMSNILLTVDKGLIPWLRLTYGWMLLVESLLLTNRIYLLSRNRCITGLLHLLISSVLLVLHVHTLTASSLRLIAKCLLMLLKRLLRLTIHRSDLLIIRWLQMIIRLKFVE